MMFLIVAFSEQLMARESKAAMRNNLLNSKLSSFRILVENSRTAYDMRFDLRLTHYSKFQSR